jgi:hypothetical protein
MRLLVFMRDCVTYKLSPQMCECHSVQFNKYLSTNIESRQDTIITNSATRKSTLTIPLPHHVTPKRKPIAIYELVFWQLTCTRG